MNTILKSALFSALLLLGATACGEESDISFDEGQTADVDASEEELALKTISSRTSDRCALVRCASGTHCVLISGRAACVAN